jgi:hypothetical protein
MGSPQTCKIFACYSSGYLKGKSRGAFESHCLVINPGRKRNSEPKLRHTVLLHNTEELDDDLGGWPDQDLALASLLGIVDRIQAVVKDAGLDHFNGVMRFSLCEWTMRYLRVRMISLQEP